MGETQRHAMKVIVLLISVTAAAAASADISNCDCDETQSCDFRLKFHGSVSTDAVPVPGQLELTLGIDNSIVIPRGTLLVKTLRRDRDSFIVPCLDGVTGSWYLAINNAVQVYS